MKRLVWVMAIVFILPGCSALNGGGIQHIAEQSTVDYTDQLQPDPQAEKILIRSFTRSKVKWEKGRKEKINEARAALRVMGKYLQTRVSMDGSLPYYTYKAYAQSTQYFYHNLQTELDARVKVKGAIPDSSQVIYYYVRRDINTRLALQQRKIELTEKGINDRASQDTLNELKGIYKAIRPLVELAL